MMSVKQYYPASPKANVKKVVNGEVKLVPIDGIKKDVPSIEQCIDWVAETKTEGHDYTQYHPHDYETLIVVGIRNHEHHWEACKYLWSMAEMMTGVKPVEYPGFPYDASETLRARDWHSDQARRAGDILRKYVANLER